MELLDFLECPHPPNLVQNKGFYGNTWMVSSTCRFWEMSPPYKLIHGGRGYSFVWVCLPPKNSQTEFLVVQLGPMKLQDYVALHLQQ